MSGHVHRTLIAQAFLVLLTMGVPSRAPAASGADAPADSSAYALRTEGSFDRDALESVGIRHPARLAYDADGNLHVLDAETRRVMKLDPRGHLLYEVGGSGTDETAFDLPVDLAVDRDQSLLVMDRGRAALLAFDRSGRFLAVRSFQGEAAEDARDAGSRLLLDRFGKLWLLAPRARDLVPLDDRLAPARTTRFLTPEDSVEAPTLAALRAGGESWVFDAARGLARFDATGKLLRGGWKPGADQPALSDLAVDASGTVLASDPAGQRLLVFTPDGRLVLSRALGGATHHWRPQALALGPNGRVAIADPERCEIQILTLVRP